MTPTGIVDADGVGARGRRHRHGDRLPARELPRPPRASSGATGATLQEHWAGEPRAYLGITVPGFPNFFMLYGPGTNGGEIVIDAREPGRVRGARGEAHDRASA